MRREKEHCGQNESEEERAALTKLREDPRGKRTGNEGEAREWCGGWATSSRAT